MTEIVGARLRAIALSRDPARRHLARSYNGVAVLRDWMGIGR